ncbi:MULTISPECIES: extracellular solute-binding protein [Pseudovibrio]|uniref:extracellular solute-binding protein n=1 Tax=Stappiaceae TaxID=2821832 RepID=UPI0023650CCA|nr:MULTISPECIES: extracellular solute-binding protein [Pseudovibrio]MDD7909278.1 extracellular solute-binding protein [Pseudovibrio exalbescens]MDX5595175.1 extracellular solute-binding protein [Pseudovibrio sp. SPO723]
MKKYLLAGLATAALMGASAQAGDLRFDGFPDFDSHLEVLIPQFQESHPDINITYQMNQHADHHRRLTTNLATGSGAGDVVVVDVSFVGSFINAGGFENLSAPEYGADLMQENFVSYAWDQGKGTDGNQYAIPVDIGPGVMYYRRDIAESVGSSIEDVIKSWDSYIEYGRKLKEKDVYLIADAAEVAQLIIYTTVKEGEGFYFDEDGKPLVTSDRFVHAFTVAKQIREEGLDAQVRAWTNEWYDGFKNGTVATQLSGAWLLGHLQNWMAPETAGLWGVSNLPDGIYGSWGGSFLAIPKQAKNKKDAWEFIKYLTSTPEAQLAGLKNIGSFPVLTETYSDASFDEPLEFLAGQKARKLFAEVAQKVPAVAPRQGDLIADDIVLRAALLEVLNDGKDIEAALRDAERLIKRRVK